MKKIHFKSKTTIDYNICYIYIDRLSYTYLKVSKRSILVTHDVCYIITLKVKMKKKIAKKVLKTLKCKP